VDNGLLVISGALDYLKNSARSRWYMKQLEDMEIIVRMRRYMEEKKVKYRVAYILILYVGQRLQIVNFYFTETDGREELSKH
jgi:hypothetical protein